LGERIKKGKDLKRCQNSKEKLTQEVIYQVSGGGIGTIRQSGDVKEVEAKENHN